MNFEDILKILENDNETGNIYYEKLRQTALILGAYRQELNKDGEFNSKTAENDVIFALRAMMSRTMDACTIYQTHANEDAPVGSEKSAKRKTLAQNILNSLQNEYKTLLTVEKERLKSNKVAAETLSKDIKANKEQLTNDEHLKKMKQYSALRRHIGGNNLIPKERCIPSDPSKAAKAWSKFKSGLSYIGSALNAVGHIFWGVASIATALSIRSSIKKLRGTSFDTTLVPGSRNDHFEKTESLLDKVNKGKTDQPIIDEKKRFPLVCEREVPGDVNAAPTLTLKFQELRMGQNIEYIGGKGMGHSFLTLQYTKIDPLTGTPKRYETSMGFYPKGGYGDRTISSAQFQKGMFVPGQMRDDSGHDYTVAKTYAIDNQKVNRILLQSLEYEKAGYGCMDRNCTNYAMDMAREAGIPDVDEIFKESEVTTDGTGELRLVNFLVGDGLSRLGESKMLSTAGKRDYSYQRNGQFMMNEADYLNLNKMTFRKEMKSYSPAHTAAMLRAQDRLKLDSMGDVLNYSFSLKNIDSAFGKLNSYVDSLGNTLTDFARKNSTAGLDDNNTRLKSYLRARVNTLLLYSNDFNAKDSSIIKRREAMDGFVTYAQETADTLSDIYHDTYKSHPKLENAFNTAVGIINRIKETIISERVNLENKLRYGEDRKIVPPAEAADYDKYVDPNLDNSPAIKDMMYRENVFHRDGAPDNVVSRFTPLEVAAGVRAFGSLKDMLRWDELRKAVRKVDSKNKVIERSEAEKKEWHDLHKRSMSFDQFKAAQKSLFNTETLYRSDYEFAFGKLPKEEAVFLKDQSPENLPSRTLQMVTVEHIFGMKTLEDGTVVRSGLKASLMDIAKGQPGNTEELKKKVSEILSDNLNGSKDFEKLHSALLEIVQEDYKPDMTKESPLAYQANVQMRAAEKIIGALNNVLDSVVSELKEKYPDLPKDFSINLINDKEFQNFRKDFEQKSGASLTLIGERDKRYEKLQEMKESGAFRADPQSNEGLRKLVSSIMVSAAVAEAGRGIGNKQYVKQMDLMEKSPIFEDLMKEENLEHLLASYQKEKPLGNIVSSDESKVIEAIVHTKNHTVQNTHIATEKNVHTESTGVKQEGPVNEI